jgi:hypothetical protein
MAGIMGSRGNAQALSANILLAVEQIVTAVVRKRAPWPNPVVIAGLVAYKFGSASARAALTSA